jgi:hypothetical protein
MIESASEMYGTEKGLTGKLERASNSTPSLHHMMRDVLSLVLPSAPTPPPSMPSGQNFSFEAIRPHHRYYLFRQGQALQSRVALWFLSRG